MKRNKWTKAECDILINHYKDNTAYFDGSMTYEEMYDMLRYRMHFGEAETMVIIACIIKCGGKLA